MFWTVRCHLVEMFSLEAEHVRVEEAHGGLDRLVAQGYGVVDDALPRPLQLQQVLVRARLVLNSTTERSRVQIPNHRKIQFPDSMRPRPLEECERLLNYVHPGLVARESGKDPGFRFTSDLVHRTKERRPLSLVRPSQCPCCARAQPPSPTGTNLVHV